MTVEVMKEFKSGPLEVYPMNYLVYEMCSKNKYADEN